MEGVMMVNKRILFYGILAVLVLLVAVVSALRWAEPSLAREDAPEVTWNGLNFFRGDGPLAHCFLETANAKDLTVSMQLPMVQWEGPGFLPVLATFKFYRWPGYNTNEWPLTHQTPTFRSQSNTWSPAFSFWFTSIDSPIGCIGACYDPGYITYTLPKGKYFAMLELNMAGLIRSYYVPFNVGNPPTVSYYCQHPDVVTGSEIQQTANTGIDPVELSYRLNSDLDSESPPLLRFDAYLPFAVRRVGGSQVATPVPTGSPSVPSVPPPSHPPTTTGMEDAGFETGVGGAWTEYSQSGYDIILPGKDGYLPRNGSWMAWLGGANDEISSITQTISVPSTHPFLSFYSLITSEEDSCYYDHASIYINEYVVADFRFCKANEMDAWQRGYVDLRSFTAQEVSLSIRMQNDESLLSSLFLDDLSFVSGIEVASATPTPTAPSVTSTPTHTPVPSSTPAPSIRNPGFELGNNGDWSTYSAQGYHLIYNQSGAHSGSWLAWLGGADNEIGYIQQTMHVPVSQPILTYSGWISSNETLCGNDVVTISVNSTPVYSYNLCSQYNSSSWRQGWVNLSAYSGSSVTVQIRVNTNASLLSSLYLDDFAFAATAPEGISNRLHSAGE
jgi:hypothetical protein